MSWWSRLNNLLRSDRLNGDLDDEQRFHVEARADDLVSEGLSRDDALREASRRFGHRVSLRETSRDVKLVGWLDSLVRDIRFGVRLPSPSTINCSSPSVRCLASSARACRDGRSSGAGRMETP